MESKLINYLITLFSVYSITKFGSRVRLDRKIVEPLKFRFQLMKFKGRMLQENNVSMLIYMQLLLMCIVLYIKN